MDSTTCDRSAIVAYDGRRFPDDPPPPHGNDGRDIDAASADTVALLSRTEQLLQDLAKTKCAITMCLARRGALCGRPLMTPWESRGVVEHEAGLNDMHVMQNGIPICEQLKCAAFGQEHETEEKDRHAMHLSRICEQPNPADPTIKDHTDDEWRQLPHQYALDGRVKSPLNEQKRVVFKEPNTQIRPSWVKGSQMLGPILETPPRKRHKLHEEWSCTRCGVNLNCEEDRLVLTALQSRQEPSELTAKSTPESSYCASRFTESCVCPILPINLDTIEPQKAKRASRFDLHNHFKGSSHQENTQALHPEEGWNHFRHRGHQEGTHALHTEEGGKEGSKWSADRTVIEDQRKKFVTKRSLPFCELCKMQCNSEITMESHLIGKKHQGRKHDLRKLEGGRQESKRAVDSIGAEDWRRFVTKRRFPFCELCKVQFHNEEMLESHLVGKKHWINFRNARSQELNACH
ncbi:hypothetical protein QYE76_005265 [Lolium multiflorum]|uniref:C2H2-type domain-containing protein n=1 Tax=Lolium multiflorum TaxID=4521 RepID=A0AAD8RSN7_LOLMU|nr:hypothetical protein QYE76_005265 [Lolium multiflorum]